MKLQRAKGTKDLLPEDKIVKNEIVDTLKKVLENYGFNPFETPILERYETLSSKYAGGSEILKETFKLKDQGKRLLGLRYDLTVPLARFIGMNPNLKMPFKRYAIGRVFRDGPIKFGRYREFWQCDADIVGCKSIKAEVEILKLTSNVFKKLGLNVIIKLNSRKILNSILEILNISEKDKIEFIMSLDKLECLKAKGVRNDLKRKGIKNYDQMTLFLNTSRMKSLKELRSYIEKVFEQQNKKFKETEFEKGFEEIEEILYYLKSLKVNNVIFDGTLARGLSYYTGPIFEVFLKNSKIKRSVAGGGRYDNMIEDFLKKNRKYPAVGISFGLDVISDAIKLKNKIKNKTRVDIYIIPIGNFKEPLKLSEKLRNYGINTDIDLLDRGPGKNMNYANSLGIPYVLFVGPKELKQNKYKLRNMKSGKERLFSLQNLIKFLKKSL